MCNQENDDNINNNQTTDTEDNIEEIPELRWDEATIGSRRQNLENSSDRTNND